MLWLIYQEIIGLNYNNITVVFGGRIVFSKMGGVDILSMINVDFSILIPILPH